MIGPLSAKRLVIFNVENKKFPLALKNKIILLNIKKFLRFKVDNKKDSLQNYKGNTLN